MWQWKLYFILCVFGCQWTFSSQLHVSNSPQKGYFEVPVLHEHEHRKILIAFPFNVHQSSEELYYNLLRFCVELNMTKPRCRKLLNIVEAKHFSARQLHLYSHITFRTNRNQTAYNQHLLRRNDAIEAEVSSVEKQHQTHKVEVMTQREFDTRTFLDQMLRHFYLRPQSRVKPTSTQMDHNTDGHDDIHNVDNMLAAVHPIYVVIHSCLLPSNPTDTRILGQLLDHVLLMVEGHRSGKYVDRRHRHRSKTSSSSNTNSKRRVRRSEVKVIVLHYGMAVPEEFMMQYERLFGGDGEGEGEGDGDGVINHDYSGMHASKTSSDDQRASLEQDDVYPKYFNGTISSSRRRWSRCLHFIHVSDDTTFFELPTMRLISYLSRESISWEERSREVQTRTRPGSKGDSEEVGDKGYTEKQEGGKRHSNSEDAHVLYLHTKGVSYAELYAQIEDWREYMMYFLVDEHARMYEVLKSGAYDVVGVSYYPRPRMLSGNYWYVRTSYMSRLPYLDYRYHGKYHAEYWLLSDFYVRLFYPHVSPSYIYPRYCFATLETRISERNNKPRYIPTNVPPYNIWVQNCTEYVPAYYQFMHRLPINPLLIDAREKNTKLYARCRGALLSNTGK